MEENKKSTFIALLSLIFLTKITTDLYIPAIVDIQDAMSATVQQAKLTMSVYMCGIALSIVACAPISKRFGKKNTVIFFICTYILSSFACVFATNIQTVIALRFIQALGGGVGTILGRLIVNDNYSEYNKVKTLSYFAAFAAFVTPIMPIIGGYMNQNIGWQSIFATIGIVGICSLTMVMLFIKKDKGTAKFNVAETIHNYYLLIKNKLFIKIIIINACAWSIYFVYLNSAPFIFRKEFGLTSLEYSLFFALSSTGYVLGALIIKFFGKYLPLENFVFRASILCVAMIFILLAANNIFEIGPKTISIMFILILMSVGITLPSCQTLTLKHFKYCSTDALSLHFFIQLFFSAILSLAISVIDTKMQGLMIVSVCVLALIIFALAKSLKLQLEES